MRALVGELPLAPEALVIFGKDVLTPRLVSFHGEPHAAYGYSGKRFLPRPWTPGLEQIREVVHDATGVRFDCVLVNHYRDGHDAMGWHADDEPELGVDPVIASVSLGAERRFRLKHRRLPNARLDLLLPDGSLLVMAGATQRHWLHALPKTATPVGPRINLTFRRVVGASS